MIFRIDGTEECAMSMSTMPAVQAVCGGKLWKQHYEGFTARVYVPENDLPGQIVNLAFKAPCLVVFDESRRDDEACVAYARSSGLADLAREYDSSVIFVDPDAPEGWKAAPDTLYANLIREIRIGPFYENGVLVQKDFFGKGPDQYYIRGAIFRVCLFGRGAAADYIALNCLKTLQGQYLWGPGEITPSAVWLEGVSVQPRIERRDIAVICVHNGENVNELFREKCLYLLEKETADPVADWHSFAVRFKRWCGRIEEEPNFATNGVCEEYATQTVTTSPDDLGRYAGTREHPVGYFAYYAKDLLSSPEKVPVVFAFHGGGDSALHICHVSGWWQLAAKYRFLLIAVENHLDVTATEAVELIRQLQKKYPIDEKRIYATGFSMGGCKTWDLFQEYPGVFAALAPMDATFDHGCNSFGKPAPRMNADVAVPVFYAGGEETPLPELPFQAQKCVDRIGYVFRVNRIKTPYTAVYAERESWQNRIWGVEGDRVEQIGDASRNSVLTLHRFDDIHGQEMVALASISPQGHECRIHTCEQAWKFMSRYHR